MSFLCANWAKGKEGSLAKSSKKTWERCLEFCLAARHHRSQLINFKFLSWACFSPYDLTKNVNDLAQCGAVLMKLPLLCVTVSQALQSLCRTISYTKMFL